MIKKTRALQRRDDAGFTLLELMTSMTILMIFVGILSSSLVVIFRTTNLSRNSASIQTQANLTFLRLDRQIRYATSISTPGVVNGDTYVESMDVTSGTSMCTELRLHPASAQLQSRTWVSGSLPTTGTWTLLASSVAGTTATPFAVTNAVGAFTAPRLSLNLTFTAGSGDLQRTRYLVNTFVALNSGSTTPNPAVCTEGRSG